MNMQKKNVAKNHIEKCVNNVGYRG